MLIMKTLKNIIREFVAFKTTKKVLVWLAGRECGDPLSSSMTELRGY